MTSVVAYMAILAALFGCREDGTSPLPACGGAVGPNGQLLCRACDEAAGCEELIASRVYDTQCGGEKRNASLLWVVDNCASNPAPAVEDCPALADSALDLTAPVVPPQTQSVGYRDEVERTLPLSQDDEDFDDVAENLFEDLEDVIEDAPWTAPDIDGVISYDMEPINEDNCCGEIATLDIYLDTVGGDLLAAGGAYRFRQRFGSLDDLRSFEAQLYSLEVPLCEEEPTRMEIHASRRDGDELVESRFKFRAGFPPFDADATDDCTELPECSIVCEGEADEDCWMQLPPRHWHPAAYMPILQSGVLGEGDEQVTMLPAKEVADALEAVGAAYDLHPMVVMVTKRERLHVEVDYVDGVQECVADSRDAMQISVNRSWVYAAAPYLDFIDGERSRPPSLGEFREIEIELEAGTEAVAQQYPGAEAAFVADLRVMEQLIADLLGTSPVEGAESKYVRAMNIAPFVRGDVNNDLEVDVADIAQTLRSTYWNEGVAHSQALNSNGDASTTADDLKYLVEYLYLGGPPPPHPFPAADIPCK